MKQILQNLKNGKTEIADVPIPKSLPGHVLIKTKSSIISAGTERMLVEFGKANLIEKARSQPEKVRMVLDKISADGLLPTIEAVQSKLNAPLPLGYCNAGIVIDSSNTNFYKGQRVISNGYHAEFVRCSKNLCAPIPDNVDDESAAFTVLGAIALQGIRLAKPTIGESIVVIGLGLVGLMTAQILKANGCKVIGLDIDEKKCELADSFGIKGMRAEKMNELQDVIDEMLKHKGPVLADICVAKEENCFPMIPSGSAHYDMILNKEDKKKQKVSSDGLALV